MDIYSFINSPDVAKHCREIKKEWNPFEMAVIINRSDRPISDKHAAWLEIKADYPDMATPKNMHFDSYPSLHEKLAEIIDYEECLLKIYKTPESGAVYTYKVTRYGKNECSDSVFSEFDKALSEAHEEWDCDEVNRITLRKMFVDSGYWMEIATDYEGNPLDISGYRPDMKDWKQNSYDEMMFVDPYSFFVDIPVPFKRGDILIHRHNLDDDSSAFVLDTLAQDNDARYSKQIAGIIMNDGSDIMGWGFYVSDIGVLYGDHTGAQDCFVYYKGKFTGNNRLLHYVSLFIRDEKNFGIPELLAMQSRIVMEHLLKHKFPIDAHGCFISENQLAENLVTSEDKEYEHVDD